MIHHYWGEAILRDQRLAHEVQRDLEVLKSQVAERLDRLMEHLGLEEVEIPATPARTEIRKKVKEGK